MTSRKRSRKDRVPATSPRGLRRVQGSGSLNMLDGQGQVLSEAAAPMSRVPPAIRMNQRYPDLPFEDPAERRNHENRDSVVINGILYIIEHERRIEVLLYPMTETTTTDEGSKEIKPLFPMIKVTAPTPFLSRASSLIETTQPQGSGHSRAHIQIPETGPAIPPRRSHASAASSPSTATHLIDRTYKEMYEEEHQLASRMQRELLPTKAQLRAERLKLAALKEELAAFEEELIAQRAEVSKNRAFTNHYKWLYELDKANTDRPEELKPRAENGEESRAFEVEADNEVVSPVSPETPTRLEASVELDDEKGSPVSLETPRRLEASAELSCLIATPRYTSREASATCQLSTSSRRVLRNSNGRPRIEDQSQTFSHIGEGPRVFHELSSSASHRAPRPSTSAPTNENETQSNDQRESPRAIHEVPSSSSHVVPDPLADLAEFLADDETFATSQLCYRQLLHGNEEYEELASHFADDSGADPDSDDEIYEIHGSPVRLAQSPSSHFSQSSSSPGSATPIHSELSSSFSSPRSGAAIYHFGPSRVEPMPAVFRVPISGSEIDYENSETDILDLALKMDAWQWCSVPDLGLRDPRE